MKNLILLSLMSFLLCVACGKSPKLSCDPEINEWAQSQIGLYENASRAEIVSLPLSKQRAIYAGLSCNKKVALWKEKIKILTESGELSQDELLDINQMMFWFESIKNQSKEEREEFNQKAEPYLEQITLKHNWDKDKVFYLFFTWMTEDEFIASMQYENSGVSKKDRLPSDDYVHKKSCNCTSSFWGCPGGMYCSKVTPCTGTENCGIMGTSDCNGYCS